MKSKKKSRIACAVCSVHLAQVFSGSPADGHLQRGDVFLSINNHDVSRMQQKQAEDIIRAAGSALSLVIKRYRYDRDNCQSLNSRCFAGNRRGQARGHAKLDCLDTLSRGRPHTQS